MFGLSVIFQLTQLKHMLRLCRAENTGITLIMNTIVLENIWDYLHGTSCEFVSNLQYLILKAILGQKYHRNMDPILNG
jgi:hypothetical protein